MNLGTAQVIRGDSRHLPLASDSVDLVVTSPPYFALRSYTDGGVHYERQIGAEPTPDEFVSSLLEVTAECVRVLKPSGSLWVNLGDKYSTGNGGESGLTQLGQRLGTGGGQKSDSAKVRSPRVPGMKPKSLIGIPWRYALRCIDDLGLILRAEVIWSKPNGLPESVTDRVRRSHEQWFHFTLSPRYYSAVDEIREPHNSVAWIGRDKQERNNSDRNDGGKMANTANPLGKLPGSVWTIPTEPLRVPDHLGVDHFAAFPTEWPKRIIAGWSPAGVCVECGEGRRPVAAITGGDFDSDSERERLHALQRERVAVGGGAVSALGRRDVTREITGYACACPEPTADTRPAVILDPFGGTGTTELVAKALGRHGITVDMSADYCRLATWRTNDRDQLAKVLGLRKPEPVDEEQMQLWA
jgi:DNA modification methylase